MCIRDSPSSSLKFGGLENNINRYFGGRNALLAIEFWQLPPTGDEDIMSNLDKHPSNSMMAMFWECYNID
eukprot:11987104-Karenia_brevis.AAC.1